MYTQKAGVESAAHKDRLDYHCCLHKLLLCDLKQSDNNYHLFSLMKSGGSRPSDKGGGGGHPDTEMREGAVSKIFFRPFGPQFGLNIRGAAWAPRAPLPWILHWFSLGNPLALWEHKMTLTMLTITQGILIKVMWGIQNATMQTGH